MSLGIGAFANLISQDEYEAVYEYGGYNWNDVKYRNEQRICDGTIHIPIGCFKEPEIHEKLKKLPSGRKKLIVKRIPINVNYTEMIAEGMIKIDNCSNCWKTHYDGIDVTATQLLFIIFQKYQIEGNIPKSIDVFK